MKKRIQYAALIAIVTVLVLVNYRTLTGGGGTVSAGTPAADQEAEIVIGSVRVPDTELRVDLLDQPRPRIDPNSVRNIFAYRLPRPPAPTPPPLVDRVEEAPKEALEDPVEIVVNIPPAPYRFFGLAEGADRRVFLTDGEGIYSALQGEIVEDRYRVVQIGDESMELEDTRAGYRWVLPLETASTEGR